MVFRTRTVILLIIMAMIAGAVVTQTVETWSPFHTDQTPADNAVKQEKLSPTSSLWEESGLTEEQVNKIASTYYLIDQKFFKDMDSQVVVDGAINGMLSALEDPYTVYMDAEQAKQFTETVIDSSFSGIGAEVTMEDGKVTVVSPIKGSPAEKAGIHAKDQILAVNGEKLEGLNLNESVMKIRGPKGTQAKLEVLRAGAVEIVEIIVVRDDIDLETVYGEMLEDNVGNIEITRFAQNTAERFHEELALLEDQGMNGLVIDVRNNPGGILHTVIELLEPLIPAGQVIVQTEDREGNRNTNHSKEGKGKSYPIVVLTNKGSASASEILAAAIQESTDHIVIGETTYGKGTVQSTFETGAKDGSNIKMTISKWLTPKGNFIHEKGVEPNITVEQPEYFRTTPLPKDLVLQSDMLGNDVKNLQLILKGLGLRPDRTDGYFSEETKLQVEAFQSLHDLPVTGQVDEQTASKLEQEIIKEMRKPENDHQLSKAIDYLKNLFTK
jgi:carboxyl-terminal processing protease